MLRPLGSPPPAARAMFDLLQGKPRDLGGFSVSRILPSPAQRAVGPFVFFDHLGPALLARGHGIAVRPHPHIGLATVTFLFDGEMIHRDSLGTVQPIRPGDVNWMTAGRGIVHSERSPDAILERALPIHAIQSWVAVPADREDDRNVQQAVARVLKKSSQRIWERRPVVETIVTRLG